MLGGLLNFPVAHQMTYCHRWPASGALQWMKSYGSLYQQVYCEKNWSSSVPAREVASLVTSRHPSQRLWAT